MFLATGTVFWWTAVVGSTWYFAHIVALDLMVLAVGIALGGDRGAVDDEAWDDDEAADVAVASDGRLRRWVDAVPAARRSPGAGGFLFGIAATARLP